MIDYTKGIDQQETRIDLLSKVQIAVVFIRIAISLVLLWLGIHVILWAIDTISLLINNPGGDHLLNNIFVSSDATNGLDIMFNNNQLIIGDVEFLNRILIIFIFIVIFNVIGRAIAAIFGSMTKLLTDIQLKAPFTKTKETD